jgi:hypothetical protein
MSAHDHGRLRNPGGRQVRCRLCGGAGFTELSQSFAALPRIEVNAEQLTLELIAKLEHASAALSSAYDLATPGAQSEELRRVYIDIMQATRLAETVVLRVKP